MQFITFIMFLAVSACLYVTTDCAQAKRASHYRKCATGAGVFQGNLLKSLESTRIRCFAECASDDACKTMNICPSSKVPGLYQCDMLGNYSKWYCKQLDTDPQYADCFHTEKTTKCMNGGRLLSNDTCRCDACFKGDLCQYHVQDCKEAMELVKLVGGYSSDLSCHLKPKNAPRPFLAKCSLTYGVTTFLMRVQTESGWSRIDWSNRPWNDYKQGFGSMDNYNYFVGLENMHYLLSQAVYRLNIYTTYHEFPDRCGPSYFNFTVGPESSDFAMAYSLHTICNGSELSGLNGFYEADTPHRFCTADRDCGTCARDNGPGWYYVNGDQCIGQNPFAPVATWPFFDRGSNEVLNEIQYFVERPADLY